MYDEIFKDIKNLLTDYESTHFRKRSDHIKRVFTWANRLMEDSRILYIDKEAVLIAALFHDVGYAVSLSGEDHAEKSAVVFDKYASEHKYDRIKSEFINYLISNHPRKDLMFIDGTPLELIILMEADLLDETGALSIVFDCMKEGTQDEKNYTKTYNHILEYSGKTHEVNPMFTERAKEIWLKKQSLASEFIKQLAYDLDE